MTRRVLFLSLSLLAVLLAGLVGLVWLVFPTSGPTASSPPPAGADVPALAVQEESSAAPDPSDWRLTLVNPWTPLPEGFQPQLATVTGGYQVDQRCAGPLEAMLAACRAAGHAPVLCSAYRTQEKQASLYQALVTKRQAQGLSLAQAQESAATEVAAPGTSEHQLGLAVDIVDADYQLLNHAQEDTSVQQWLLEHCWDYGFILRYPADKGDVTGIIYEPWHYRYVGREHAQAIRAAGLCLEEYLSP